MWVGCLYIVGRAASSCMLVYKHAYTCISTHDWGLGMLVALCKTHYLGGSMCGVKEIPCL